MNKLTKEKQKCDESAGSQRERILCMKAWKHGSVCICMQVITGARHYAYVHDCTSI